MKPAVSNSSFLRFSKWVVFSALAGCTAPAEQPISSSLCAKVARSVANQPAKAMIIIADNSCLSCNREYTEFLKKYLSRPDILFIISAHENVMDISPYIGNNAPNIIFDSTFSLTDNNIIHGSTVLLLGRLKVDTVVSANVNVLDEQLAFIDRVLGGLSR